MNKKNSKTVYKHEKMYKYMATTKKIKLSNFPLVLEEVERKCGNEIQEKFKKKNYGEIFLRSMAKFKGTTKEFVDNFGVSGEPEDIESLREITKKIHFLSIFCQSIEIEHLEGLTEDAIVYINCETNNLMISNNINEIKKVAKAYAENCFTKFIYMMGFAKSGKTTAATKVLPYYISLELQKRNMNYVYKPVVRIPIASYEHPVKTIFYILSSIDPDIFSPISDNVNLLMTKIQLYLSINEDVLLTLVLDEFQYAGEHVGCLEHLILSEQHNLICIISGSSQLMFLKMMSSGANSLLNSNNALSCVFPFESTPQQKRDTKKFLQHIGLWPKGNVLEKMWVFFGRIHHALLHYIAKEIGDKPVEEVLGCLVYQYFTMYRKEIETELTSTLQIPLAKLLVLGEMTFFSEINHAPFPSFFSPHFFLVKSDNKYMLRDPLLCEYLTLNFNVELDGKFTKRKISQAVDSYNNFGKSVMLNSILVCGERLSRIRKNQKLLSSQAEASLDRLVAHCIENGVDEEKVVKLAVRIKHSIDSENRIQEKLEKKETLTTKIKIAFIHCRHAVLHETQVNYQRAASLYDALVELWFDNNVSRFFQMVKQSKEACFNELLL